MKSIIYLLLLGIFLSSCGSSDSGNNQRITIEDLPFAQANSAKTYADLILKAIKTNREKPLSQEFTKETPLNLVQLNRIVSMYSSGIGGRKDWDFHDFSVLKGETDQSVGFDYAWLDQKGRLGIQIFILPKHDGNRFYVDKVDFRSRLDIMDSVTFPSGDEIDNYKKIDFDWKKK